MRGKKFGRWTAISDTFEKGCQIFVTCRCECGTTRDVREYSLASGHSKSCGVNCKANKGKKSNPRDFKNVDHWINYHKDDHHWIPAPASEPTTEPPGTVGKVMVMRKRLESGEDLYHPDDAIDFSNARAGYMQPDRIIERLKLKKEME